MRVRQVSRWQQCVCLALLVVFPVSLVAQETEGAMLNARGNVTINGRPAPNAQAVLPGDLTVTGPDSAGNMTLPGSSLTISPETALRFEGTSAVLERGGVAVTTQRGFTVRAGCMTILPIDAANSTEFAVNYENPGTILIQARRGDVRIAGRNGDGSTGKSEAVQAGREVRRESCPGAAESRARRPGGGAAPSASTGPLNSTKAIVIGAGLVGGVAVYFLTRDEKPPSPERP